MAPHNNGHLYSPLILSSLLAILPSQSVTIIGEQPWDDDYVAKSASSDPTGWTTLDEYNNMINGMTGNFHGLFTGDDVGCGADPTCDFEPFTIYRSLQCQYRSTLSISYDLLYCDLEANEDHLDFQFNDVSQSVLTLPVQHTSCRSIDTASNALCTQHTTCNGAAAPYHVVTTQLTDFVAVEAGQEFTVKFIAGVNYLNDDMFFTNVQITCNRIITPSPSTDPTPAPSGHPTAAPSRSPTNDPSASPSNAPSESPSTNPSNPPSSTPSISPTVSPKQVIWYELMIPPIDTSAWTMNASTTDIGSSADCPVSGAYCWSLTRKHSYTNNVYMYRTESTRGYSHVSLTYSIYAQDMNSTNEACQIAYGVSYVSDSTDWTELATVTTSDGAIVDTVHDLPSSTWDRGAVSIRLSLGNTDGGRCSVRNWNLRGVPMDVAAVTPSPTMTSTDDQGENEQANVNGIGSMQMIVYVVVGVGGCFVVLLVCVVLFFYVRHRRAKQTEYMESAAVIGAEPRRGAAVELAQSPVSVDSDNGAGGNDRAFAFSEGDVNREQALSMHAEELYRRQTGLVDATTTGGDTTTGGSGKAEV